MVIELTISQDTDTGMINVNGPLDQEVYCLGLLEKAKDAVRNYSKKERSNLVVPARLAKE